MIDVKEVSNGFEIKFAYNPTLVEEVKKLPSARFNGIYKHWFVPTSSQEEMIKWLQKRGFKPQSEQSVSVGDIPELPELDVEIPLRMSMFPYQRKGVAYGLKKERLIIGDEPGLGKTAQAIALAEANGSNCVLVICPATLKQNWKIEIENKWTHRKALILTDRVKGSWHQFNKVGMIKYFICNYEGLKKFFVESINKPEDKPLRLNHIRFNELINLFDCVIVDESHRCKEGKTQQSKFVMGICKGKKNIYALTGTPLVNKPKDLIPQLHIIGQLEKFGGYKGFSDRYCQGSAGASNLRELNYYLNVHCFYRRLKKDVLTDLPDKLRSISHVDITTRQEYKKAEDNLIAFLRENLQKTEGEITKSLRGETLVLLGILKKIAAKGKVNDLIEHIQEVTDAGEKIVVFAWHRDIVQALKQAIPDSLTIVGDNTLDQRQSAVEQFQNNPHKKVMICNIKSGGVGITLTASSRVAFIELPWHSADSDQCEDRCHRIGQRDSVQCTYFIGENTVDQYIYDIIERKRSMASKVMGDNQSDEEEQEQSMVDELIQIFSNGK